MSAAHVNWLIELGTTLDQSWLFKAAGVALDISGWHCKIQIRDVPGGTLLFDADDTHIGNIAIDGPTGRVTVTDEAGALELIDITKLPKGQEPVPDASRTTVVTACGRIAWYGLTLTDTTGKVRRILQAKAVLSPTVVEQ